MSRAEDDGLLVLRVSPGWRAEVVSPAEAAAVTEATVAAETLGYWAWSATVSPQRLPADRPLPTSLEATAGRLEVEVGDGRSPLPAGLELLAAPVAMWEEVPEAAIPAWSVPEDGRLRLPRTTDEAWRLRLVGRGIGGAWIEVSPGRSRISLHPEPTTDRALLLLDPADQPVPAAALRLLQPGRGDAGGLRAAYLGDGEGGLTLPGLPADLEIEAIVLDPGFAPLSFEGRLASLPSTLQLSPGAALEGRLVDGDGRPVAGADVHTISFLAAGSPRVAARSARSAENGRWRIAGLAPGQTQLTIRAEGFARLSRVLDLDPAALQDLGSMTLGRAWTAELRVADPAGRVLSEAEAATARGRRANADAEGIVRITELALDGPEKAPEKVTVSARGFLPATVELTGPTKQPLEVVLSPSFRAVGRLLSAEGSPIAGGRTTLSMGSRSIDGEIQGDGSFEVEMPPATSGMLVLSSPQTAELRVTLTPGEPGEVRELGDLVAPPSRTVTGRLVAFEDGLPVAGARVWAVRSADDPLYGFARGDLLEAQSDSVGQFTLSGLATANALVRIDAPGLARHHLDVAIPDSEPRLDVGTIELHRGSEVVVRLDQADVLEPRGLVARLDLRGAWLESDMLTASVVGDVATFTQVPAGPATVSVMRAHELVCDREIEVPTGQELLEVDCLAGGSTVRGHVLMGEVAVGPGQLTWSQGEPRAPSLILRSQVGALEKAQVYWGGRPGVVVPVDAGGYFETDALRAGVWSVAWASDAGRSLASPLEVRLTEAADQELTLRLPLLAIAGTVVDAEGRGVEGARVRELDQGAFAIADERGGFRLEGLEPGALRLQARLAEASSEVEIVELAAETAPPAVELELVERQEKVILSIAGEEGRPAAGAMVFLQAEGEPLRLLTADLGGRLEMPLHPPYPSRLRAAAVTAGRWVFGEWVGLEAAREGMVLELGSTGGLELSCEEACGTISLRSTAGWDLTAMSLRLGRRLTLSPEQPLSLAGLPPGRYLAALEGWQASIEVEAGEVASRRAP